MIGKLRVYSLSVTSLWALAISAVKVVIKYLKRGRLLPRVFAKSFVKKFVSEQCILSCLLFAID
jgi:hypothetical protein